MPACFKQCQEFTLSVGIWNMGCFRGFFRVGLYFALHGRGIKVNAKARAVCALIRCGVHGIVVKAALGIAHHHLEGELPGGGGHFVQAVG